VRLDDQRGMFLIYLYVFRFGYVEFTNAQQAQSAIACTDKELNGRPIRVDLSLPRGDKKVVREHVPSGNPPASTLFLGNLSFEVYEENLTEIFAPHGTILSIRLPTDRETGAPKGFGYCEFSTIEEAQAAHTAINGTDVFGRGIRIDYAAPRAAPGAAGGEWDCECGNNNFARRDVCFKCQAPRVC
jgi:nucleolin